MDFIVYASSAAVGSILGVILKELFDLWRSTRAHRQQLQSRYFDVKLEATIRAIQQIKTSATTLRAVLNLAPDTGDPTRFIAPGLIAGISQNMVQTLQRVNEQAAGVIALVGFYYDDALVERVERGATPPTELLQDLSEFLLKIQRHDELARALDGVPDAPANMRALIEAEVAAIEADLPRLARQMRRVADELDTLANEVIRKMRDAYKHVRF